MSCECDKIQCIKVYVSPCDTGVDTTLTAPVAGNYFVRLRFNGAYKELTLSLTMGERIILPNIVNENYVHELQVYTPSDVLLGNTCYSLDVKLVLNESNGLTPSPSSDPYSRIITITDAMLSTDGLQLTNSLFGGKVINQITTNDQSYLVGVNFTQSGNTIIGNNPISFFIGQVIKVSW